jgi:hypothetical protein
MKRALCVAALVAMASGCPRLPPPPPRPSVVLERMDRADATRLLARLRVHNHGAIGVTVSAVDWELARGARPLVRGRSRARRALAPDQDAAIEFAIALPAPLAAELGADSGGLRLRGAVHLRDSGGRGRPAPFDEAVPP